MLERTLVLCKPDTVQRQLVGRIISRFEDVGFKIVGMKMVWVDKEFAAKHYKAHVGKGFYPGLEQAITEGPVIALVLEGVSAVDNVRKLVGSTEPKGAPPGTIRGDFSHHSYASADARGRSLRNIIHASGNLAEAKEEVALWFTDKELHSYKTVHELHTF